MFAVCGTAVFEQVNSDVVASQKAAVLSASLWLQGAALQFWQSAKNPRRQQRLAWPGRNHTWRCACANAYVCAYLAWQIHPQNNTENAKYTRALSRFQFFVYALHKLPNVHSTHKKYWFHFLRKTHNARCDSGFSVKPQNMARPPN